MLTLPAHPLYFIRHGTTDWNEEARYQGQTDTSLSQAGRDDARRNGLILQHLLNRDAVSLHQLHLISSPLKRARQSARVIADTIGLHPGIETRSPFRELSMGRWEGLTSAEVKDQYYKERNSRKSDRWRFRPLGGESMHQRCPEIENALLALEPGSVLVTHSMVLKVIFHLLTSLSPRTAALESTPHVSVWYWNGAKMHRQGEN